MDLLKEASGFKDKLKIAFTINRKIANTAIGRDVTEALASYEVPVLKNALSQRVGFAESAGKGLTVLETDPKGPAAREVAAMVDEILEMAE